MTRLAFVDTETTGLGPACQAWEIAVITRDESGEEETLELFVEVNVAKADPAALDVGRFYDRHPLGRYLAGDPAVSVSSRPRPSGGAWANYVSGWDAAQLVARATHGAHLVGVNPAFDADVLARLLRNHGVAPRWSYHLVDVTTIAVGWLNGRGPAGFGGMWVSPPWSSTELSEVCGVPVPEGAARHTALGDARWARRWFDALVPSAVDPSAGPGGESS